MKHLIFENFVKSFFPASIVFISILHRDKDLDPGTGTALLFQPCNFIKCLDYSLYASAVKFSQNKNGILFVSTGNDGTDRDHVLNGLIINQNVVKIIIDKFKYFFEYAQSFHVEIAVNRIHFLGTWNYPYIFILRIVYAVPYITVWKSLKT